MLAKLSEERAYAAGIKPKREQLILTLSLGITVAVSIKVVGIPLIAAMLIIPAAAARQLARTPEAMVAITAVVVGYISVIAGLNAAFHFDTPTAPTILCVSLIAFILLFVMNANINGKAKGKSLDRNSDPRGRLIVLLRD